jgi:hypothetical protein
VRTQPFDSAFAGGAALVGIEFHGVEVTCRSIHFATVA